MKRTWQGVVVLMAGLALAAGGEAVLAQGKGKDKEQKEQHQGKGGDKDKKPKKAHHKDGKQLVGENIKKNGKHKIDKRGDYEAQANVSNGKIAGIEVKHATKGNVKVTKYKTNQKMAEASPALVPAAFIQTQAGSTYVGTTYIGYAYWDEYTGEEVIYWFPYDMIQDGETGAIEYVPAY